MKKFGDWIEEKRKATRVPMPTTPTSAPLRGANQDYSGVNAKGDVADYTISDDTQVRNTPVNMKTSSHTGGSNAPVAGKSMQRAADQRRIELDKQAQQRRDQQKRDADAAQREREADAKKRENAAEAQRRQKEEEGRSKISQEGFVKRFSDFIGEGRGGSDEEDTGDRHLIYQMRKVKSTRGQHKVTFRDGKKHEVSMGTADRVIAHHDNLSKPADKEAFVAHASKSMSHMHDALAGKKEPVRPKVTLAGRG